MKKLIYLLFAALIFTGVACDESDSSDDENLTNQIVGDWLSEGTGQVAPALAANPFRTARIDARFNDNNTYRVVSTDSSNVTVTFEGTWQITEPNSDGISEITLNQTVPSTLTSEGIVRIVDNAMEYEVIQTQPAIQGFTPATPEDGFGSTSFNGTATGGIWTQRYVRQ